MANSSKYHGQIKVGRRIGTKNPKIKGFENIVVMMRSHCPKWYPLSPYALKNEKNHIFENIWQFSKVYEKVPYSKQNYSRYDDTVIWEHQAETHVRNGKLQRKYWLWRKKGFCCKYPVRYPVGFRHRVNCLYSVAKNGEKFDYIESRKKVYLQEYCRLVRKTSEFQELKKKLKEGKKLLIIEVDGPHQESLNYYKEKYDMKDDFIENNTVIVSPDTMKILINDPKHCFGHGYCLGIALLDMDKNDHIFPTRNNFSDSDFE